MSNILKASNLVGPGFEKTNFFQAAKEVSLTFKVDGFIVVNFKLVETVYTSSLTGSSIIYQNNLALIPVQVSDPQSIYSGVTILNVSLI